MQVSIIGHFRRNRAIRDKSGNVMIYGGMPGISPYVRTSLAKLARERKMDKSDKEVTGNDIVIIMCMAIATILLAILVANLPFGIVG